VIKSLLLNNGKMSDYDLGKKLLEYDISQIEYYQKIVNNMVGKVLRRHGVVYKDKDYFLTDFESLDDSQKKELVRLCDERINKFLEQRGDSPWKHRSMNREYIPGSVRYEVLKRAKFRCELCGISAEERALQVDHIAPKSTGGEDSINNYQALCCICNESKGNKDDEDFRKKIDSNDRDEKCIFCNISNNRIVLENNLAYATYDAFPVTQYHALIVPKRHVAVYFDLVQAEINACNQLINKIKKEIDIQDKSVQGYNIGINNGEPAGQTIFHCHIHLIPRRNNDVKNPKGGMRHIIPEKGFY
jgi:diadenosine tetraphosphate (Ap4A) HIT family hydrolase/5-methylcytosine-specific restriction endonuclease McrA